MWIPHAASQYHGVFLCFMKRGRMAVPAHHMLLWSRSQAAVLDWKYPVVPIFVQHDGSLVCNSALFQASLLKNRALVLCWLFSQPWISLVADACCEFLDIQRKKITQVTFFRNYLLACNSCFSFNSEIQITAHKSVYSGDAHPDASGPLTNMLYTFRYLTILNFRLH